MGTASGVSRAMAETLDDLAKSCLTTVGLPEIVRATRGTQTILDSLYRANIDILQNVAITDSGGKVLLHSPQRVVADDLDAETPVDARSLTGTNAVKVTVIRGHTGSESIRLLLPINEGKRQVGTFYATLSIEKLAAKCFLRAAPSFDGYFQIVDEDGRIIFTTGPGVYAALLGGGTSGINSRIAGLARQVAVASANGGRSADRHTLNGLPRKRSTSLVPHW